MATTIDQKAYLQKYLSGPSSDKKKKKKKSFKGKGLTIIDADVDITKMRTLEGDELDFLGEGEDAPQIAGIIDERPEEIRKLEHNTTTKWRVINQDDGFNSKLQVQEIKRDVKEVQKDNEIVFGKMYSDSEDEQKNDSDLSPPRKKNKEKNKTTSKHNSDSDFSPPRKKGTNEGSKTHNSDSDMSPPRKNKKESSNKSRKKTNEGSKTKNSDSDISPPRKNKKESSYKPRHKRNEESKSNNSDSDMSPPRKNKKESNNKVSQRDYDSSKNKKASSKNYDSDQSPPRRKNSESTRKTSRWGQWETSDDTQNNSSSKSKHESKKDQARSKKIDSKREYIRQSDSDESPRRENRNKQNGSDSDLSPPRKKRTQSPLNHRHGSQPGRSKNNSPPPTSSRMAKTLDGKVAGLQDAKQLRDENEDFRRREDEAFKRLGDEVSGRNAKAVSRKGKRETSEERQKQKDKAERQKVLDEKYKKWSAGLKQIEDKEARYQDFLHEASKPLARHVGDTDLEDKLKSIERDGDPMLKYMREKKRERGELGPERPMYKGNFPPNRFNIRPGHRWDGVDRSNGYETKYFQNISKRRAHEEEAYKWSTEDL